MNIPRLYNETYYPDFTVKLEMFEHQILWLWLILIKMKPKANISLILHEKLL